MYILKKKMSAVLFEIFLEKNVGKKDQNMTNPSHLKLVKNQIREVIIICAALIYFGLLNQKGIS